MMNNVKSNTMLQVSHLWHSSIINTFYFLQNLNSIYTFLCNVYPHHHSSLFQCTLSPLDFNFTSQYIFTILISWVKGHWPTSKTWEQFLYEYGLWSKCQSCVLTMSKQLILGLKKDFSAAIFQKNHFAFCVVPFILHLNQSKS